MLPLTKDDITLRDIPEKYVLATDNLRFMMAGKIDDPFQGCACSMADVTRHLVDKLLVKKKEILLVDMEAGVESFGRGVERSIDTVLIVVEASFESLALAEKIGYMAEGIGVRKVRAILNKVPSEGIQAKIVEKLKEKNIWVCSTLKDSRKSIYEADFSMPLCLVIGSEEKGVRPLVQKQCDLDVTIPINDAVDSLNASVAAAVVLFEIKRQRNRD